MGKSAPSAPPTPPARAGSLISLCGVCLRSSSRPPPPGVCSSSPTAVLSIHPRRGAPSPGLCIIPGFYPLEGKPADALSLALCLSISVRALQPLEHGGFIPSPILAELCFQHSLSSPERVRFLPAPPQHPLRPQSQPRPLCPEETPIAPPASSFCTGILHARGPQDAPCSTGWEYPWKV